MPPPQHRVAVKSGLWVVGCGGPVGRGRTATTRECIRGGGSRGWPAVPVLVFFVFVSCVVPLSTPSSTQETVTLATLLGNASFSNGSLVTSSEGGGGTQALCPTAKLWIDTRGSFCFTLAQTTFLRNASELRVRERRAIDMFCDLDRLLEKVDCAQPYSVNVDRRQCWLCREAYRDWACAMMTDTLEDGSLDCEGGVMPCPSCASICHQVMRLCPYLTPDRVQFDEDGAPTPHVSQYGGHPAFYCPLENIHASDPAYTSDCRHSGLLHDPKLHDSLHNSCAENAKYMSKRSAAPSPRPLTHISTCCWTYASSLVQNSQLFEKNVVEHGTGYYNNRVILNCCDATGNCISSDPDGLNVSSTAAPPVSTAASGEARLRGLGSTLRTANNQVRGEDGTFRELSNAYLHDEPGDEEEEEDEEYYDDSSSSADSYSSGASSHESRRGFYESSSSVLSIHRDNKIYVTRESRSVHEPFYIESSSSSVTSAAGVLGAALSHLVFLLLAALAPLVFTLRVGGAWARTHLPPPLQPTRGPPLHLRPPPPPESSSSTTRQHVVPTTTTRKPRLPVARTDHPTTTTRASVWCCCCCRGRSHAPTPPRRRCSCCEYSTFVSNYSNVLKMMMMNLPIKQRMIGLLIRLSDRKLVVNLYGNYRYDHVVMVTQLPCSYVTKRNCAT